MIDKNRYGPRCSRDRPTRSKESEISEQGCRPNRDSFSASRRPHPNRLSRTQWVGIIVSSRSYTGREALAHFAAFDTFHTAFATLFTQETATKGGQAKGEMRISTMYEQIPEEDRGLTRHQGSRDFFSPAAAAAVAADIPSVVQLLACRPERRSGGVTYGSLRCVLSGRRTLRRVTTVLLGRVAALRRTVVTGRRTVAV